MADSLLEAAKAEYARLKKKHAQLQKETDEVEGRMDELELFFRLAQSFSPNIKAPMEEPRVPLRPRFVMNTKAAVTALAEKLLAGGKTMATREILAAADQAGIKVGGKTERNRIINTSAILSRSGVFKPSSEGWSLKAEQSQLELPKSEGRTARTVRPSVAA